MRNLLFSIGPPTSPFPPSLPPPYLRGRDRTKRNLRKPLRRVRTITNAANHKRTTTKGDGSMPPVEDETHDIFLGHLGELLWEGGREGGSEGEDG